MSTTVTTTVTTTVIGSSNTPTTTIVAVPSEPGRVESDDSSVAGPVSAGIFIAAALALAAVQARRKTLKR